MKLTYVLVRQLDQFWSGGEEASWSGGKHSALSSKSFLYVSNTLSRNPQDSAVSLKQFNFEQKEIPIKYKT
jgi:hypothetical protein